VITGCLLNNLHAGYKMYLHKRRILQEVHFKYIEVGNCVEKLEFWIYFSHVKAYYFYCLFYHTMCNGYKFLREASTTATASEENSFLAVHVAVRSVFSDITNIIALLWQKGYF
jgi:hypothetical protein